MFCFIAIKKEWKLTKDWQFWPFVKKAIFNQANTFGHTVIDSYTLYTPVKNQSKNDSYTLYTPVKNQSKNDSYTLYTPVKISLKIFKYSLNNLKNVIV